MEEEAKLKNSVPLEADAEKELHVHHSTDFLLCLVSCCLSVFLMAFEYVRRLRIYLGGTHTTTEKRTSDLAKDCALARRP